MGSFFSWTKGIYFLCAMAGIIAWKMIKVDNLEAKQAGFESIQMRYETRLDGYDRELENVRIISTVSEKRLEDIQKDTREIKQLLLNKK